MKLLALLALLPACASTPAAKPIILRHLPLGTEITFEKKIVPEPKSNSFQLKRAKVGELTMVCIGKAIRPVEGEYFLKEAWASLAHLQGAKQEIVPGRTPIAEYNFMNDSGQWLHLFCEPYAKDPGGISISLLGRNPEIKELTTALEQNGIKVALGDGESEQDISEIYRKYEADLKRESRIE